MKYRGKLLIVVIALTLVSAFGACVVRAPETPAASEQPAEMPAVQAEETAQPEEENVVEPLGAFTALDTDGNEVTERVFSNADLTMLNVWATYCGPCLNEMPDLGRIAAEYADKGLQVIGLVGDVGDRQGNVGDEELAEVRSLVEKTSADYLHLLPSKDMQTLIMSEVYAFPTTFFFDREGRLLGKAQVGSRSEESWKEMIDLLLSKVQFEEKTVDGGAAAAMPVAAKSMPASSGGDALFANFSTMDMRDGARDQSLLEGESSLTMVLLWDAPDPAWAKAAMVRFEEYLAADSLTSGFGVVRGLTDATYAAAKAVDSDREIPQLLPTEEMTAYFADRAPGFYVLSPWGDVLGGPIDPTLSLNELWEAVDVCYNKIYYSSCCG